VGDVWIRLHADFFFDPKIMGCCDGAALFYIQCITYSRRALTDGLVPYPQQLSRYKASHMRELVEAGLLVKDGKGVRVLQYEKWQQTKAQVEALTSAGRKGAAARWVAK
jgi:hypothetical protein